MKARKTKITTTGDTILLPPSGTLQIGTEFEIRNEGKKTVKITDGGKQTLLKPGHKRKVWITK